MNEQLETDFRRKAFHEAGHALVASVMGIPSEDLDVYVEVRTGGEHGVCYHGVTVLSATNRPPYNFSIIGWAGVLAEELAEMDLQTWKAELPSLWQRYNDDLQGRARRKEGNGSLSFQDMRWIIGYSDAARTFKDASEIIEKEHESLLRVANRLMLEANHNPR